MYGVSGSKCFCSTWEAEVRRRLVSYGELTTRSDKVKLSVQQKPRGWKETKVYKPQILEVIRRRRLTQRTSLLEPGKNSRYVSALPFSTSVCCLFSSSWCHHLSFYTVFLSLGNYLLIQNKPLCSLTKSWVRPLFTTQDHTWVEMSLYYNKCTVFALHKMQTSTSRCVYYSSIW